MNPDRLADLEQERTFLLRSLVDLDHEHDAGDIDDADYAVVRDGYVARAAAVLRAIDDGHAVIAARAPRRRGVVAAWVIGVVVVASLCGWLVARSSGQRLAGQTMTGGQAIDDAAAKLAQARRLLQTGDFAGALDLFQQVNQLEPDNAEARTYTAWLVVLTSQSIDDAQRRVEALDAAMAGFQRVITDEPSYADPWCLSAVAAARFLDPPDVDLARQRGEQCLAKNPPSDMRGLIDQFLAGLDSASTTTTAG